MFFNGFNRIMVGTSFFIVSVTVYKAKRYLGSSFIYLDTGLVVDSSIYFLHSRYLDII